MTLFDYKKRNPPHLQLSSTLRKYDGTIVGHSGTDQARNEAVAVFPRCRDEHYFRKYEGYAISADILENTEALGIETVYIVETDRDNYVREFDHADFVRGTVVAYLPDEDTIVENPAEAFIDDDKLVDPQRVVPDDHARQGWPRENCVIKRTV